MKTLSTSPRGQEVSNEGLGGVCERNRPDGPESEQKGRDRHEVPREPEAWLWFCMSWADSSESVLGGRVVPLGRQTVLFREESGELTNGGGFLFVSQPCAWTLPHLSAALGQEGREGQKGGTAGRDSREAIASPALRARFSVAV